MTINVQVSCIKKRDRTSPHERIEGIGGWHNEKRWHLSEDDAIRGIDDGTYKFYTAVGARSVWVVIASRNGRRYLKTEADDSESNNLLSLPECP